MHVRQELLSHLCREAIAGTVRSVLRSKGTGVFSVAPGASVYDAVAMMADHGAGALLVMSGPVLIGVVSERDYARKVVLKGRSSKETAVSEIMTTPVVTVGPDVTILQCLTVMTECRVRHLPVVEGAAVMGVVSMGDLVNDIISAQADTIDQLNNYIRGVYPA